MQQAFCQLKERVIFQQQYGEIGVNCYVCGQQSHLTSSCPQATYFPDIPKLVSDQRNQESRTPFPDRTKFKCYNQRDDVWIAQKYLENIQKTLISNLENQIIKN